MLLLQQIPPAFVKLRGANGTEAVGKKSSKKVFLDNEGIQFQPAPVRLDFSGFEFFHCMFSLSKNTRIQ